MDGERWKYIPGSGNKYAASTMGRVASVKDGRLNKLLSPLDDKPTQAGGGEGKRAYLYYDVQLEGEGHHQYAQKLIALTWGDYQGHKYFDGCVVDHLNHNRRDNRVSNLRITTSSENNKHSYDYKNKYMGGKDPNADYYI